MADESLWRARLRWRWRGALLWPLFVLLTVGDALLLGVLPIAGDEGTDFVPALLLAGFFNLLVVAVVGPLAAVLLRRRRPDLPRMVAQDYTGRVGLVVVTLAFLAGGLVHRPRMDDAQEDLTAQFAAAREFVALTVLDALLLGVLPIAGDEGTDLVPALLLAGFFNLLVVAVIGPLTAVLLRRRRPDLPRVVAQDYTGRIGLVVVTLGFLAGGLVHRPRMDDAQQDLTAQFAAAREFVARSAPAEFRAHPERATTLRLDDDLLRTCVPGPDPKRWFCVLVRTDTSPPGIKVDDNRESNESLNAPGGF